MALTTIAIIRIIAALGFLLSFFITVKIYSKTKSRTDIWLLISFLALVLFLESAANTIEWLDILPKMADDIGEDLIIAASLVWVYIAYRFLSIKDLCNRHTKTVKKDG